MRVSRKREYSAYYVADESHNRSRERTADERYELVFNELPEYARKTYETISYRIVDKELRGMDDIRILNCLKKSVRETYDYAFTRSEIEGIQKQGGKRGYRNASALRELPRRPIGKRETQGYRNRAENDGFGIELILRPSHNDYGNGYENYSRNDKRDTLYVFGNVFALVYVNINEYRADGEYHYENEKSCLAVKTCFFGILTARDNSEQRTADDSGDYSGDGNHISRGKAFFLDFRDEKYYSDDNRQAHDYERRDSEREIELFALFSERGDYYRENHPHRDERKTRNNQSLCELVEFGG